MKKEDREKSLQEMLEVAYAQAEKYGLTDDFIKSYKFYHGDIPKALEDWDLLDEETLKKLYEIKQRYAD